MKILAFAILLGLSSLALGCGGGADCRSACDKLTGCGLKALGLPCDPSCSQAECVDCIVEKSCDQVANQACQPMCTSVTIYKP